MKKFHTIIILLLLSASFSTFAQGNLQFNRVLIVSNAPQTVPAGKVWKVECVFGEQVNACLPVDCWNPGFYARGIATGLYVNGVLIPSAVRGFKSSQTVYSDVNCNSYYSNGYDLTCSNKTPDPNILPLWLPAGTTVSSIGNTTFASVIEFNIIP
jgi:hypothetical protein